jgi:quercetin dioxygenase-like cupin family protein
MSLGEESPGVGQVSSPPESPFFSRTAATNSENGDDLVGIQGVTAEVLARGGFPDAIGGQYRIKWDGGSRTIVSNITDSKDVVLAKLTFAPNGFVGWHTHPGPAIVAVSAGELTVTNEIDCVPRTYHSGQSFVDPGQGNIHVAVNTSSENAVVYATFVDIPPGQGPTALLSEPGNCN